MALSCKDMGIRKSEFVAKRLENTYKIESILSAESEEELDSKLLELSTPRIIKPRITTAII